MSEHEEPELIRCIDEDVENKSGQWSMSKCIFDASLS
jgi:hypothetical protein